MGGQDSPLRPRMRITWRSRWFGSHFVISHGETIELPWVRPWWLWGSFGLRSAGSDIRFRNLFEKSGLAAAITTACSDAEGKPVLIQYALGDGPWYVPWERAAEYFKEEATATSYVPVRTAGEALRPLQWRQREPLRSLIIFGHQGTPPLGPLDLERERKEVMNAWENLDDATKARVNRPDVVEFHGESLVDTLSHYRPHILWFSGHGRSGIRPALLDYDHRWVDVDDFAGAMQGASIPIFCVFWACQLGTRSRTGFEQAMPLLCARLAEQGIKGTVAMQSPVGDNIARDLAVEMFRGLAAGFSLERATSRARGSAARIYKRHSDFASPAVWLSAEPVERVSWRDEDAADPFLQTLLAWDVSRHPEHPAYPFGEFDEASVTAARAWADTGSVIVGDVVSEEFENTLMPIATAALSKLARLPIVIRLKKGVRLDRAVNSWAVTVLTIVAPEAMPTKLGQVIEAAATDGVEGLRRLLAFDDVLLVLIGIEPTEKTWVWQDLQGHSCGVIIATESEDVANHLPGWPLERPLRVADMDALASAFAVHSDALATLAMLDLPLHDDLLADLNLDPSTRPELQAVFLQTRRGTVLVGEARRWVLGQLTDQASRRAHAESAGLLEKLGAGTDRQLMRLQVGHYARAGEAETALQKADAVIETLFHARDHAAIVATYEDLAPLQDRREDLGARTLLRVADAYLRLGRPNDAEGCLDAWRTGDDLDRASLMARRAEIEKAVNADSEMAVNYLESAITLCRSAEANADEDTRARARNDRFHYQHDLARVRHYLLAELDEAEVAYQQLIEEIGNEPQLQLLSAIARRNLADCFLFRAAQSGDDGARQRAEALLDGAATAVGAASREPLLAEISYERVRLRELEGDGAGARVACTQAIEVAHACGSGMMEALARVRLFWLCGVFDYDEWVRLDRRLEPYDDHGWAARVAINNRLRAAKCLMDIGQNPLAVTLLERNATELARRPNFDRGSDRRRIAQTYAGLALAAAASAGRSPWEEFLRRPWAVEWLAEHRNPSIHDIWVGSDQWARVP